MRKIVMLLAAFALILSSCNEETTGPQEKYAEFSIGINEADFITLKGAPLDLINGELIPECKDLELEYARVTYKLGMNGTSTNVSIPIFKVGGKYVTQPVKVVMDTDEFIQVYIEEFLVYNKGADGEIDADPEQGDDILVKATPHSNSNYYQFINPANGLRDFRLDKFTKEEVIIDVLCYDELVYKNFGFVWFNIQPITIRQMCFFGDICVCEPESYSLYYGNEQPYLQQVGGGTMYDLIAYMQIVITNEKFEEPWVFTNYGGVLNDCLPVYWPDYDLEEEEVTVELQVLLPVGNQLEWVSQKTWTFTNIADGPIPFVDVNPEDGINDNDDLLDFVIGDCHEDAELILPSHLHLPTHSVQMTNSPANHSVGSGYKYFQIVLDGIGDGYSIKDGTYFGWCGDSQNTINSTTHTIKIMSSLNWVDIDNYHLTKENLMLLNYIVNKLPEKLANYSATHEIGAYHTGKVVQALIWKILNPGQALPSGYSNQESEADVLAQFALDNIPVNYTPEVGDRVAVIFFKNTSTQVLFTTMGSPCDAIFQ